MAPGRDTAEARLERLLYLFPAAGGEGRPLADLARTLDVAPGQLLQDLAEVTDRAYYQHAGSGDDLQILIDGERVRVWTTGEFRRPVRLGPLEALALGLGLRTLAAGDDGRRADLVALARRLEATAAACPADELLARFALDDDAAGHAAVRPVLERAATERRRCRISYLASGAAAPSDRVVHPYLLARAPGAWYLVAHCTERDDVRLFRLDRILAAEPDPAIDPSAGDDGSFPLPADFDASAWLVGGRAYRADREVTATVRYAASIARWIREKGPVEEQPDGAVVVRLPVADPAWLVRHVLQYAPDAEVLAPAELRREVAAAVAGLAVPAHAPARCSTGRPTR
jgi:proteasome accessory factor C